MERYNSTQRNQNGFDRTDSRVFFAHSCLSWLSNGFCALLILLKLEETIDSSWWLVFGPRWVSYLLYFPLQAVVIAHTHELVQKQMGPPPGPLAGTAAQMHDAYLRRMRQRSHIVTHLNATIDSLSQLVVMLLFCRQLQAIQDDPTGQTTWGSFRVMFIPFWVSWFLTNCLSLTKDRSERSAGNARELHYVFFLFVACKLDNVNQYSWKVVFIIPWLCFVVMMCMACMILFLLLASCAPLAEHSLQLGIFCMFMSFSPQFFSYLNLVNRLDGDTSVSYSDIMIPNTVSWFLLFFSSVLMWYGLRSRERRRAEFQEFQEALREHRMEAATLQAMRNSVEDMTDEDVASTAENLAAGKVKPVELYRMSASLFRRMSAPSPPISGKELLDLRPNSNAEPVDSSVLLNLGGEEGDAPQSDTTTTTTTATANTATASATANTTANTTTANTATANTATANTTTAIATTPTAEITMTGHPGTPSTDTRSFYSLFPGSAKSAASEKPVALGSANLEASLRSIPSTSSSPRSSAPPAHATHTESADRGVQTSCSEDVQMSCEAETFHRASAVNDDDDDGSCIICCDAQATCVFLECGHGGVCKKCAFKLWVHPPNECPTCRAKIDQVVELEDSDASYIGPIAVKQ